MQKNTRLPPRHLRLTGDPWLNQNRGEPQFAPSDAVFGEPSWFLRTYYPGHTVEDLADYYRRSKNGAPIMANPQPRLLGFQQQMMAQVANLEETPVAYEDGRQQSPMRRDDRSWALVIAAVIVFAAAIVLAAAIISS